MLSLSVCPHVLTVSSQTSSRMCPGGRRSFMLAALTSLLIDLFSERSANTQEQTCNGTINQSETPYHSVPGARVCARWTVTELECLRECEWCVTGLCRCVFLHSVAHECTRSSFHHWEEEYMTGTWKRNASWNISLALRWQSDTRLLNQQTHQMEGVRRDGMDLKHTGPLNAGLSGGHKNFLCKCMGTVTTRVILQGWIFKRVWTFCPYVLTSATASYIDSIVQLNRKKKLNHGKKKL